MSSSCTNLTSCFLIWSFYSGLSTYQLSETVGSLPNGKNSTLNQSDPLLPMSEPTQSYDERECSCPREYYQRAELNSSLFFADCKRSIDFVLAYRTNPNEATEAENEEKRRIFQENLIQQGLEVEFSQKDQIYFVKVECLTNIYYNCIYVFPISIESFQIHAPLEVLRRYAEILKLRMPMKEVCMHFP